MTRTLVQDRASRLEVAGVIALASVAFVGLGLLALVVGLVEAIRPGQTGLGAIRLALGPADPALAGRHEPLEPDPVGEPDA